MVKKRNISNTNVSNKDTFSREIRLEYKPSPEYVKRVLIETLKNNKYFTFNKSVIKVETLRELIKTADEVKAEEYQAEILLNMFDIQIKEKL